MHAKWYAPHLCSTSLSTRKVAPKLPGLRPIGVSEYKSSKAKKQSSVFRKRYSPGLEPRGVSEQKELTHSSARCSDRQLPASSASAGISAPCHAGRSSEERSTARR